MIEFCAQFWPQGAYGQLIMAFLISATLINARYWTGSKMVIVAVMWTSWVGARTATEFDNLGIAAMVCLFCAWALIYVKTDLARLICALYLPRVVILSIGAIGLVPVWIIWEANNLLVILQIILLAGGAHGGTLRRIDNLWSGSRRAMSGSVDIVKGGANAVVKAIVSNSIFGRKT